jgi:23S rRNA (cytosine1962-C5)-methyltransferase
LLSDDRYQLIDFGDGRKLESLAGRLVDRPSPAAAARPKSNRDLWSRADSFFDVETKAWSHRTPWPAEFSLACGPFRMPIRPTPFGHIGLFPEQACNWSWLARPPGQVASEAQETPNAALETASEALETPNAAQGAPGKAQGLNLFGYTGASTMAMVAAGLEVVHVDAAKPNVQAARLAAQLNGWQDRPIRYLVDDARKFAAREVRRERSYHTIVLDPPAYGHGSSGAAWRLARDLGPLLDDCLRLLSGESFRLLVTGHSRDLDQADVFQYLQQNALMRRHFDSSALRTDVGRSQLKDSQGRSLDAGFYVRIERLQSK